MNLGCILAIVIGLGLEIALAPAAGAQSSRSGTSAPVSSPQADAQAELTELFAAFCLMKFPDADDAALYAHAKGFKPMPAERVRAILGAGPGSGWTYDTGFGTYSVTIEKPPIRACAIRKRFGKIGDIKGAFGTLLTLWAATQHTGTVTEMPMRAEGKSGPPTRSYQWQLAGGKGKETFVALVTPAPREELEIRLVRSISDGEKR